MRLLLAFLSIVALAFFTRKKLVRQRKAAGIKGWVKDQDLDGRGAKKYLNQHVGVMCKPDVLQQHRRHHRVTEYKSAHCTGKPFPSDLLQLAGEMMATGATEGELKYGNNKSFVFTMDDPALREAFRMALTAMGSMRQHLATKTLPAGKPSTNKCKKCTFRTECSFSAATQHN